MFYSRKKKLCLSTKGDGARVYVDFSLHFFKLDTEPMCEVDANEIAEVFWIDSGLHGIRWTGGYRSTTGIQVCAGSKIGSGRIFSVTPKASLSRRPDVLLPLFL